MNANDPDTWGSAYICIGLECIIILVYAMDMWLVSRLTSTVGNEMTAGSTETSQSRDDPVEKAPLVTSHWNQLRMLLTLAFTVDLIVYVCAKRMTFRVSTCLRPIMIVLRRREFRHMMRAVFVSATRIVRVLTLMAFHIVFFGFVAFVFFSTVDQEHTKFRTLSDSILEMLLIVTSPGAVLSRWTRCTTHRMDGVWYFSSSL